MGIADVLRLASALSPSDQIGYCVRVHDPIHTNVLDSNDTFDCFLGAPFLDIMERVFDVSRIPRGGEA
jgi:hypothetical protein